MIAQWSFRAFHWRRDTHQLVQNTQPFVTKSQAFRVFGSKYRFLFHWRTFIDIFQPQRKMTAVNGKRQNIALARGINTISSNSLARTNGRFQFAKKKAEKKIVAPKTRPNKKKWYPADYIPKRLASAKTVRNSKKTAVLRKSITPGTVLILLSGRFRGKRVVFLKQLPSGTLLVTGTSIRKSGIQWCKLTTRGGNWLTSIDCMGYLPVHSIESVERFFDLFFCSVWKKCVSRCRLLTAKDMQDYESWEFNAPTHLYWLYRLGCRSLQDQWRSSTTCQSSVRDCDFDKNWYFRYSVYRYWRLVLCQRESDQEKLKRRPILWTIDFGAYAFFWFYQRVLKLKVSFECFAFNRRLESLWQSSQHNLTLCVL